ncbi:MAG: hypothetical protein M3Z24_17010, partial [Chloroflexota bacterium]|nr:hypothetical protein [Chloroflexota bacterium]
ALTCLSLGLAQQGTELGPVTTGAAAPQNNPIALALALVFLIAFIMVERKVRWPVVDLSLFKRFPFTAASLVSLLVGAALMIAMADIPIFVDTVMQLSVLDSGLALMRLTIMIPLGALLGGWLCQRISCRFTGVLGLLFTAVGFYLMSRWPIHVDWTQITISTITAGFGFGLVIAPIGTTAINAVRTSQAGMSSAVVTALRMVGMTLGLAALTSWALAYFKQLAAQYPSLPSTATSAQFNEWSKGYATHLIASAHTVYTSVFFTSMVLCLFAIIPAVFLWGRKPAVLEEAVGHNEAGHDESAPTEAPQPLPVAPTVHEADTVPGAKPKAGPVFASTAVIDIADLPTQIAAEPAEPPKPPDDTGGGDGDKGGNNPRKRRRLIIALVSCALVLLLVVGGVSAALLWQSPDDITGNNPFGGGSSGNNPTQTTVIPGYRMIQLALDDGALTSLFTTQLGLQQGTLSNLSVVPVANDGIILGLNLHIDTNGIHRVMPIEMRGMLGIDKQQNILLNLQYLTRDGIDAGPATTARMQQSVNTLMASAVMPALRGHLKGVKLISVHTSAAIGCAKGTEMLVLLVQAPPIDGVAAQPTPAPLCFKGPIDLNKLLPHG